MTPAPVPAPAPRPPRRPATALALARALVVPLVVPLALALAPGAGGAQTAAQMPGPVPVSEGTALVSTRDIAPLPLSGRGLVRIGFPDPDPRVLPVRETDVTGPGHALLNLLYRRGFAAGNWGDVYENRDRGHSVLRARAHPQLVRLAHDEGLRARGLDYGLSGPLLVDAPLIGNSSTAFSSGPYWRSLPRLALTGLPEGPAPLGAVLFQNYLAGQIHVYPAHRDHPRGREGEPDRDLLPANTPYMIASRGSSGSDRAHLEALAMILAAFRPDTKAFLRETGLVAPTVQKVYRRGRVADRAAYLSGAAHPAVFSPEEIDLEAMVRLANTLVPGTVPPMVRLAVEEEDRAVPGRDMFLPAPAERLLDTPAAIARVWRSSAGRRSMVVSAAATADPNGRPLRFAWVLLRGDPARSRIEPLDPGGTRARITLDWQDPDAVSPGPPSGRVEIGVFAHNGVHDSAPAFVTVLLPRHETRVYAEGPDGVPRPVEIDRAPAPGSRPDPALFPLMAWRDVYLHAADGTPEGWIRHGPGAARTRFDAAGRIVAETGQERDAVYAIAPRRDGTMRITFAPAP